MCWRLGTSHHWASSAMSSVGRPVTASARATAWKSLSRAVPSIGPSSPDPISGARWARVAAGVAGRQVAAVRPCPDAPSPDTWLDPVAEQRLLDRF